MVEALLVATLLAAAQGEEAEDLAADAVAVPAPATPEPEEREGNSEIVSLLDYQIAQVTRLEVASGRTKVSVESNAPSPRSGTFPVRFFIDNSTGPRQVVTLSIRASVGGSSHAVTRAVEVNPGERRTVNVPVPSEMRYGSVRADGPGIGENAGTSMYFQATYEPQRVVLSISRPEQFEKFVGRPPRYSGANVLVHAVPPAEAPGELASYLGYDCVTVPDGATLDSLDENARRALEAYVATGGHLLVGGAIRSTAVFPLLKSIKAGTNDYGFGKLLLATGAPSGGLDVFREGPSVMPHGPMPEYERRYNAAAAQKDLLLPQATAPLGRFLLIIALFTLAIGPGSVWVARRRGPAALLVTIPATAIVTCVLIISYSVIADGFVVHGSSYGYTLLDSREHRTLTQGVTAYYANLAPSKATFGPSTVVVAPTDDRRERYVADFTWRDGLTLGGDFVPSRTYREWGFVSVEPSRARLIVKRKGNGWVVQNALGVKVERLALNVDGRFFSGGPVRDGGEDELQAGNTLDVTATTASSRFGATVMRTVTERPLKPGEFLARVEGQGLVPTGGIGLQLHEGEHWVRGEYEE